jgi:glycosyltransferase involved in cell wall biosynthesis
MSGAASTGDRVSVVIPLFDKARYVGRALRSVSGQSFSEFEVVVVDDGSTDGGADVVRAHADFRVRLVRQTNEGEGAARNRGIAESRGELVAMLDADDTWDPFFLETVVDLWDRFPEAGLVATAYRSRYRGGFTLETRLPGCDEGCLIRDYFATAARAPIVWSSAQAVPRRIFDRVGVFQADPIGIDSDMWGRIALRYPLAYSSRTLATYHNDVSGSRMLARYERRPVFPPFVRSAREALARGEVSEGDVTALRRYLNVLLLQYARQVVAAGDRRELRRALREEFHRERGWHTPLALLRLASAVLPLFLLGAVLRARLSRWAWAAGLGGDRELVRRAADREARP